MAAPRRSPASRAYVEGLKAHLPQTLIEALAVDLGYREARRTPASLLGHLEGALPAVPATGLEAPIRRLSPLGRAMVRWVFGRLSRRAGGLDPEAEPLLEALPLVRRLTSVPAYDGLTCVEPGPTVAALVGGVTSKRETLRLSRSPEVFTRGFQAQTEAAGVRAFAERLLVSGGQAGPRRMALDGMRAALPRKSRLPSTMNVAAWDLRIWRAAALMGLRAEALATDAPGVGARLIGNTPADFLANLATGWLLDDMGDELSPFELFGPGAWRLAASLESPPPRVIHRIAVATALETLPVDKWVEVACFAEHLYRQGLLPPTCARISFAYSDPRGVGVANMRPDTNDGAPFRVDVPTLLHALLGIPAVLGIVDVALAPPGESVLRFTGPKSKLPVCESPYQEVTHIRRTSLGASWLDSLPAATGGQHGPGVDGLDALAALLG